MGKAIEEQNQVRPLSDGDHGGTVRAGSRAGRARVEQPAGGDGIRPGRRDPVVSNGHPGPFVVIIKDVKMVLGRGVAQKIRGETPGNERSFFFRQKLGVANNGPVQTNRRGPGGQSQQRQEQPVQHDDRRSPARGELSRRDRREEGRVCTVPGARDHVVDLPGTYSLTAYSAEELITRHFILEEKPDVVVDVVDASNIERNLYLGTQLIEMDAPLVFAFNMSDLAKRRGLVFDLEQLSRSAGGPDRADGGEQGRRARCALLEAILETAREGRKTRIHTVGYGDEIEEQLARVESVVRAREKELADKYGSRWVALKLLEQDDEILAKVRQPGGPGRREQERRPSPGHLSRRAGDRPGRPAVRVHLRRLPGDDQELRRAAARRQRHDRRDRHPRSPGAADLPAAHVCGLLPDLHRGRVPDGRAGIALRLARLGRGEAWPADTTSWLRSLLVDGVIGGVGGVLVFLPNILLLFLAIALLEDTGYMARAAFVMDRIMHKIGLHGKSFIPMLIGFGCSVPGDHGHAHPGEPSQSAHDDHGDPADELRRAADDLLAADPGVLRSPLAGAGDVVDLRDRHRFWPSFCAKLLRMTIFRGETMPFVMELPPYRMPTPRSILIHTWQRGWMYLKKAGTVILGISIVLWAVANFPRPPPEDVAGLDDGGPADDSVSTPSGTRRRHFVEPVLRPLGFDWKIGTALIGSLAAKEVFVSQMGIVYAVQLPGSRRRPERQAPGRLHAAGRVLHHAVFPDLGTLRGDHRHDAAGDRLLAMGRVSVPRPDGSGLWRDSHCVSVRQDLDMNSKLLGIAAMLCAVGGTALSETQGVRKIQDNSFLLEEAYNQEEGVIQHIQTFQYMKGDSWAYSFTQEWPVPTQTHQLSYTIPYLHLQDPDAGTGFGDVLLNYRYQALLKGPVAFSPRVSLVAPTGDYREGLLGSGAWGVQGNLPLSLELSERWVTHWNLGATHIPRAKGTDGSRADITGVNYGASIIYLVNDNVNLLTEFVGGVIEAVGQAGRVSGRIGSSSTPGCGSPSTAMGGFRSFPA